MFRFMANLKFDYKDFFLLKNLRTKTIQGKIIAETSYFFKYIVVNIITIKGCLQNIGQLM